MKKIMILFLIATTTIYLPTAYAAGGVIRIKGVKIDGGAMSAVGITLTYLADETPKNMEKFMNYAGWTLIVAGLAIGSGSISNSNAAELPAKPVWRAMVSEARLAANGSPLIDASSPIVNAANRAGVSTSDLANLTLKVNQVELAAASEKEVLTPDQIAQSVASSPEDLKLAKNLATIAMMSN